MNGTSFHFIKLITTILFRFIKLIFYILFNSILLVYVLFFELQDIWLIISSNKKSQHINFVFFLTLKTWTRYLEILLYSYLSSSRNCTCVAWKKKIDSLENSFFLLLLKQLDFDWVYFWIILFIYFSFKSHWIIQPIF